MDNGKYIPSLDAVIRQMDALAGVIECSECRENYHQIAEWLRELSVYKRFEECGFEMPKPKRLLRLEKIYKGFGYACPYCGRGVIRVKGLQQCNVCGGMVDNDNIELASGKMKLKSDRKPSWR